MVNRIFKYHEVTLADPDSLPLIWYHLQEALGMCVINCQQSTNVTMTTDPCPKPLPPPACPVRLGLGAKDSVGDQVANAINTAHSLQPAAQCSVLGAGEALSSSWHDLSEVPSSQLMLRTSGPCHTSKAARMLYGLPSLHMLWSGADARPLCLPRSWLCLWEALCDWI